MQVKVIFCTEKFHLRFEFLSSRVVVFGQFSYGYVMQK